MSQSQGNNPFDDEIKKRLEEASFQPPKGIWDQIEKELPIVLPFYYRFKYPIAAAIFAFTVMSSLLIYNRYENSLSDTELRIVENKFPSKEMGSNGQGLNSSSSNVLLSENNNEVLESANSNSHKNSTKEAIIKASTFNSVKAFNGGSYSAKPPANISNESISDKSSITFKEEKKANKKKKSIAKDIFNKNQESIVEKNLSIDLQNNTEIAEVFSVDDTTFIKENESIETLDMLATSLFEDDANPDLESKFTKGKKKNFKNKFVSKGLLLGPLVGAHYTAMTKKSDEGVNTSNLEQTATFGKSYGLNIGYVINQHWTVGMEWIYNSDEGQRFKENIKGQNIDKYLALDYMKIPLYVKYSHKFVTRYDKSPVTFNFVGGLHYSKLKSVNTFINNQIAPVQVNYNDHEWGMLGGVEFDIYATNRIFFTLGSRVAFNADLKQFPRLRGKDGSDPFSIQAGVYAKINYVFSFKK